MYAQSQVKIPPVRPRSSLSHVNVEHRKESAILSHQNNSAVITTAGLSLFLFLLCVFLLGVLIYVGRRMAEEKATIKYISDDDHWPAALENSRHTTKSIVRLISGQQTTSASAAAVSVANSNSNNLASNSVNLQDEIMVASKVTQKLSHILPRDFIQPQKYFLKLQPDLKNKTFSGQVTVQLKVLKPIDYIPIHAKFLTVSTDEVLQLNKNGTKKRQIKPAQTFSFPKYEYWVTEFDAPLEVGNYSLRLLFNGSLTDRIVGFYQSSYIKKVNEQIQHRSIATSKFEPTYARQAFPCFDEPAMKAIFAVTLVRPTGTEYHALSNMNIESEKQLGELTEVKFADSVLMSTYLVCFIVSDFAFKSKVVRDVLGKGREFEIRVFSTEAQINKVDYALKTGVAITEYYINYFKIEYPLPKLDMAAIPDFVSGAMEHWGLVTFRETALLYDPTSSSTPNKQRVATVVAHELAHSWFGNLVTMKWWNDLWLNEGFASYIEYKGVNQVHPEWHVLDQFLIESVHDVMRLDGTLASHPIVQTVESPSEITELFDSVTYSKGASIIRMLEDLVGPEKFQNATTNYLNKYSYQNAETDDFLTEIELQNFDFDVKLIMETWTVQMGLPVVKVIKTENGYKLTQNRFLSNPEDYNNTNLMASQFNYRWSIPITYFTSEDNNVNRVIFNYNDNEMTLPVSNTVSWIKLNKDQNGFYRANYDVENWQALTATLNTNRTAFSVADRAHLINDVFSLADASQLSYGVALNLATYLENEMEFVPWRAAMSHLIAIKNFVYFTDIYSNYAQYVRQLLDSAYKHVTWNINENHLENLLRVSILNSVCEYGNSDALQKAGDIFNEWMKNTDKRPNPDIRAIVYFYGMQIAGDEKNWNRVWELFLAEQDAQEKMKLMESLSAIKDPLILKRYIDYAWNESNVRTQDYFTCLIFISRNPAGQSLVWDYVRENWSRMTERFGINERYLGRLLPTITKRFSTKTKLEEIEAFFAKYPNAGAGAAARKQALETVKYNINWLEENLPQVDQWLKDWKSANNI